MPISNKRFEDGRNTLEIKVADFFIANPLEAFTFEEIAGRINLELNSNNRLSLMAILIKLERLWVIETKFIDGDMYYRIIPNSFYLSTRT